MIMIIVIIVMGFGYKTIIVATFTIQYDTMQYIYMRSKADEIASSI